MGYGKQRECTASIQSLLKLQPWFMRLRWKTCLWQNSSLGSCACSKGLALGENTVMMCLCNYITLFLRYSAFKYRICVYFDGDIYLKWKNWDLVITVLSQLPEGSRSSHCISLYTHSVRPSTVEIVWHYSGQVERERERERESEWGLFLSSQMCLGGIIG